MWLYKSTRARSEYVRLSSTSKREDYLSSLHLGLAQQLEEFPEFLKKLGRNSVDSRTHQLELLGNSRTPETDGSCHKKGTEIGLSFSIGPRA